MSLYHISSHPALASSEVGQELIFVPGPQAAEGPGVYFSEGQYRPSAPDAIQTGGRSVTGILVIDKPSSRNGWYRAKSSAKSTIKGARTWHTNGRSIRVRIDSIDDIFFTATIVAFS